MQKEVFPPLHEVVVKALDLRVNQKLDLFDSLDDRTQSGRQDGKGVVGEVDLVLLQKELVVGSLALPNGTGKKNVRSQEIRSAKAAVSCRGVLSQVVVHIPNELVKLQSVKILVEMTDLTATG